jgi:microcin C transport system substrate-binding protein
MAQRAIIDTPAHSAGVTRGIVRIGPREVLFTTVPGSMDVRDLVGIIGAIPILPRHYWQDRDITKTTTEPPLGSGPYRIGEVNLGRKLTYNRVENYWGKDIAVNKGRYNFAWLDTWWWDSEKSAQLDSGMAELTGKRR